MTALLTITPSGGSNGASPTTSTADVDSIDDAAHIAWDSANVLMGPLSLKYSQTSGTICRVIKDTASATTEIYGRAYKKFSGKPASSNKFLSWLSSSGVQCFALAIASTGKLFVRTTSDGSAYTAGVNDFTDSQWYRFEYHVVANGASGSVQVRVYLGHSTTVYEDTGVLVGNFGVAGTIQRHWDGSLLTTPVFPAHYTDLGTGMVVAGDSAGGWLGPAVLAYTASPADSAGLTDASSTQSDYARAPADPAGLTDATSMVAGYLRTTADPAALSDAASVSTGTARAPADPLSITDTANQTLDYARAMADSAGLTDSVSVVLALGLATSAADALPLSDVATVSTGYAPGGIDAVGLTDAATVDLRAARLAVLTDSASLTDAVAYSYAVARVQADTAALSDVVVIVRNARDITITDAIGGPRFTDAISASRWADTIEEQNP